MALQPPDVLEAILAASPYPGGIARIQGSQSAAARSFEVLLEDRTPGSRVVLWALARHPELIRDLIASGQKPAWQREHMASSYAEEVREAAIACEGECHDALVRVDALHAEATAAFEQVIEDYPAAIRKAFRTLLAAPGALSPRPALSPADGRASYPMKERNISSDVTRKNGFVCFCSPRVDCPSEE